MKRKRPSRKPQPAQATTTTVELPWWKTSKIIRLLSPTNCFWASVCLVLTLVGAYYLLRPQLEIEPDNATDPKRPMTTPFRITNRSVLPIYDVRKQCGVNTLATDLSATSGFRLSGLSLVDALEPAIPRLEPGESTSVYFQERRLPFIVAGQPIIEGDICVVVRYRTALLNRHCQQVVRFETRRDQNGESRWYHKAVSE